MSTAFKDKPLKEKKVFYRERQKFFDAVKAVRDGEEPIIKYNHNEYKLIPFSWEAVEEKRDGWCVIFSKRYKSNTIVYWWYSDKRGFRHDSENGRICYGLKNVLCLAQRIK